MIRRVSIQDYKSLRDVEIYLQPLTVIFGPNAAGKSNLLDALALLSRMVTSRTIKEAFEGHRGTSLEAFRYESTGIKGLLQKERARFSIEVDVELSAPVVEEVERRIHEMRKGLPNGESEETTKPRRRILEPFLRYRVVVETVPQSGVLRVLDEKLVALTSDGQEKDPHARKPFIYPADGRLRLRMEGQARPTEHPIGLDYTLVSQPLYPPHYPHVTAFREELARWRFYYFEPRVMRQPSPIKETDSLGPFGEDLAAFYHTLRTKNRQQFEAASRALNSLIPAIERIDVQLTPDGFVELSVVEDSILYSARVISEGTLRLLGLLAVTNPLSPATLVGYEEPENGVHPRRLRLIADLLKETVSRSGVQIIVNTHSPIFPEYFEDEMLIVCRKGPEGTRFERFSSAGPLFRKTEIAEGLSEEVSPLWTRIVRGDWDG
ncbi:MAG: AAA family ATPase [Thermoflexales bacterium]|nr:AAA family ATPase [Thermoflexales bacterium]